MSLDWLGKKIVEKVVAIYFFTVYDNTSLQQDNALVFAHISHFSQISIPLFKPYFCAQVYYTYIGCCTALHNLCLPGVKVSKQVYS